MNPATRIGLLCLISAALLTACGSAPEPQEVIRPVLAVQPQVAASRFDSFAGEVHAGFEPTLAFRVGGKVMTRLVDSGDRVSAGQVLATLDPSDLACRRRPVKRSSRRRRRIWPWRVQNRRATPTCCSAS